MVVCAAGSQKSEDRARKLDLADEYFHLDATDAVAMYNKAMELTNGELFDLVINCVNIENTEMASILLFRSGVSHQNNYYNNFAITNA